MDSHLAISLAEIVFTLFAVSVTVGQFRQKSVDHQESILALRKALLSLEAKHATVEKDLQRRIYECREESLKHATNYVTRDEFFASVGEIRSDIKRLIGLVSRRLTDECPA